MTLSTPPGFLPIGQDIWLVDADKEQSDADDSQPTLILIFGWMDAKLAHVAKFSAGYRTLFPAASQLVIASSSWACFFRGTSGAAHDMQPALDYLLAQGVLGDNARPHRILTHAMSNGGCFKLDHLARLLSMSPKYATSPLTKSAMVIDSAPGGDELKYAFRAFQTMIPSPFLRYPTLAALFSFHTASCLVGRATWLVFEPIRQGILNPMWLPWVTPPSTSTPPTPWLFIYSKLDQTVPFDATHKLTEVAEARGMDIRREIYEESQHVAHMRADPIRYWTAVKALWEDARKTQ